MSINGTVKTIPGPLLPTKRPSLNKTKRLYSGTIRIALEKTNNNTKSVTKILPKLEKISPTSVIIYDIFKTPFLRKKYYLNKFLNLSKNPGSLTPIGAFISSARFLINSRCLSVNFVGTSMKT